MVGLLENNEYCKKCFKCCINTQMILTRSDIERLVSRGYRGFYELRDGFYRLVNKNGKCIFLDESGLCRVYPVRPIGCRSYPLVYDEEEGVVLDPLCPLSKKVKREELAKGVQLLEQALRELEETYSYGVDWELFRKSSAKLLSK